MKGKKAQLIESILRELEKKQLELAERTLYKLKEKNDVNSQCG